MINIKETGYKINCLICNQKPKDYRKIFTLTINNYILNLCTDCLLNLDSQINNTLSRDLKNTKRTSYDNEIESLLRFLLNKKVSNDWDEECELKFNNLDENKMCNCNRVMYCSIKNW